MALGPVEYIVVGFPGNRFDGHIAPELAKLVEAGTIRILDLVFIPKDDDGDVAIVELEDHHDADSFHLIEGEIGGFVSHDDVEYAAAELEPGSSAALLVWEDVWAAPFVAALRNSGGVLLEIEVIVLAGSIRRTAIGERDGFDSWLCFQTTLELVPKHPDAARIAVLCRRQADGSAQQAAAIEAEIHVLQFIEAGQQESGNDQQRGRNRELRGDQRAAQPAHASARG